MAILISVTVRLHQLIFLVKNGNPLNYGIRSSGPVTPFPCPNASGNYIGGLPALPARRALPGMNVFLALAAFSCHEICFLIFSSLTVIGWLLADRTTCLPVTTRLVGKITSMRYLKPPFLGIADFLFF